MTKSTKYPQEIRELPSYRAVNSRGEAFADPQGSLNSVPLGPGPRISLTATS